MRGILKSQDKHHFSSKVHSAVEGKKRVNKNIQVFFATRKVVLIKSSQYLKFINSDKTWKTNKQTAFHSETLYISQQPIP